MGGKEKRALLVSIQEQSKSPLSRACSGRLFHLYRVCWVFNSHVQCLLSCTKRPFQIQEARGSSPPSDAYLISLPPQRQGCSKSDQSSWPLDSHKMMPCAVYSGHKERSQLRPLSGHGDASLWNLWLLSQLTKRLCCLLLQCSQSDVSRYLVWYFLQSWAKGPNL